MKLHRLFAILPIYWGIICPLSGGDIPWTTGPELQIRLGEKVDIVLAENPLRRALEDLSHNKNVAVLIDRRVDPSRKIQISLDAVSLSDAFKAIAQNCGLGISMVGPVAYFAPPAVAQRVRTLVALREEDVRLLPSPATKIYLHRKSIAWADLAAPRELLQKLASDNGIEIAGLDQVPHDLWAAADLPPLNLIEALTLIAAQYDLTFQISTDGNMVTLLPVPENVELARNYPVVGQPEEIAKKYASLAPQARIQIAGDKIIVTGLIEDHERITASQRPAARRQSIPVDDELTLKRFTLTVEEKPLGPVLKQLAEQMNLKLMMDENALQQAGISLHKRVSFSVKDATVDELLHAALQQSHLKFQRRGNIVQIEPSREK